MASHARAYQRWPLEPFPAERTSQQRPPAGSRAAASLAGEPEPAGQEEAEVRRDSQHVGLTAGLQVLPQLSAAAVDLIAAGEVEPDAVSEHLADQVDGQLPLGPERQARGQLHHRAPGRILEMLTGDPLPGGDQRVPGSLAGIGQVHGSDPVSYFPGAAQVVALDAGGALALLDLAGLIDRPDGKAPAAAVAGGLVQSGDGEPAHRPHHRQGVPDRPAEQPLHPVRRPVPGPLGQRPAITSRQITHQRSGVLAGLQPRLHPRETRTHQFQQLIAFPPAKASAYPGGSSRLRSCCPHKRMIARRLRHAKTYRRSTAGQTPNGCCRTRRPVLTFLPLVRIEEIMVRGQDEREKAACNAIRGSASPRYHPLPVRSPAWSPPTKP